MVTAPLAMLQADDKSSWVLILHIWGRCSRTGLWGAACQAHTEHPSIHPSIQLLCLQTGSPRAAPNLSLVPNPNPSLSVQLIPSRIRPGQAQTWLRIPRPLPQCRGFWFTPPAASHVPQSGTKMLSLGAFSRPEARQSSCWYQHEEERARFL